jgi:hypothetical protein
MPVGNTAQRPAGVTGQFRFNQTINSLEIYDNQGWTSVGQPDFTLITDQQFIGDGSTTVFTLSGNATTAGSIVSINGVQQLPVTAYAVSGTTLTFTEAPGVSDIIDVRVLVTTNTIYAISNSNGNAQVGVEDGSNTVGVIGSLSVQGDVTVGGNITIAGNVAANQINNGASAVQIPVANGNVNIDVGNVDNMAVFSSTALNLTGNIVPTANAVYSLGSAANQWKDLYVSNNTIYIGGTAVAAGPSGLTVAGNPVVTANASGTSTTTGNMSVVGTVTSSTLNSTGAISATGTITGGNLSVGTGTITGGNIVNSNANGVGNIGSASTYFNTVFAKATSAQYADLAEMYAADAEYAPGTVVSFGGDQEITVCAHESDTRVAGVVSTNPSYIMNAALEGEHVVAVALTGRVPTRVVGTVAKGDLMVSAGNGAAKADNNARNGAVIGKALEDFDGAEGTIEVVVGRF